MSYRQLIFSNFTSYLVIFSPYTINVYVLIDMRSLMLISQNNLATVSQSVMHSDEHQGIIGWHARGILTRMHAQLKSNHNG